MSPVLANRLLSSLSNKLKHFDNEPETPCMFFEGIVVKTKPLLKLNAFLMEDRHKSHSKPITPPQTLKFLTCQEICYTGRQRQTDIGSRVVHNYPKSKIQYMPQSL